MGESLVLRGTLEGHSDWVTSIATPLDPNSETILSGSRSLLFYRKASNAVICKDFLSNDARIYIIDRTLSLMVITCFHSYYANQK